MQLSKSALRKHYRDLRAQLTPKEREQAALQAAAHLTGHPLFQQSEHIACYLPFKDELSTLPLIEKIWQADKFCYLPILVEGKALHFVRYDEGDPLQPNLFSIPEPQHTSRKLPPENLNLVVTPLISFDLLGHRLGTGGGYYDRTFAFLQAKPVLHPILIGYAYDLQLAPLLPADPWDITLNFVATENGVRELLPVM